MNGAARIKICGITSANDARLAIAYGAQFIGLIFAESSPRRLTLEQARAIVTAIDTARGGRQIKIVGVFQDQPIEFLNTAAEQFRLDLVQLHGSENHQYIAGLSAPVIKAFQFVPEAGILAGDLIVQDLREFENAQYFLIDSRKGSGITLASHCAALKSALGAAHYRSVPLFIAGGMRADVIAKVVGELNPFAIDVASGVESEIGKKSEALIAEFCRTVGGAARETGEAFSNGEPGNAEGVAI